MIVYQAHNHLRDTFYVGKTIKIIKCCKGRVKTVKGQVFAYAAPGVYGWTQL